MQDEQNSEVEILESSHAGVYARRVVVLLFVLLLNGAYWVSTNPVQGGPRVVMGSLFLLFLAFYQVLVLLIMMVSNQMRFIASPTKVRILAVMIAVGGVILVGLNTLDQLGVADVALVVLIEAMTAFYIMRRF